MEAGETATRDRCTPVTRKTHSARGTAAPASIRNTAGRHVGRHGWTGAGGIPARSSTIRARPTVGRLSRMPRLLLGW